jgi:hydroxypyruvate isomerase
MKLSAGLELMLPTVPRFEDRVRAVADAGFDAVEIWRWSNKELDAISRAASASGVRILTICLEPDADLANPDTHERLFSGAEESARVSASVGCELLILKYGKKVPGIPLEQQRETVIHAIREVADRTAAHGVGVAMEILNDQYLGPDNLVLETSDSVSILREVDHPHARLLYDRFHTFVNGEQMGAGLECAMDLLAHVQGADHPGRGEFGSGTMDWVSDIAWLLEHNYSGYLGIEAETARTPEELHRHGTELIAAARRA